MKVIIENLAKKLDGEPETELPENTVIRFEFDNYSFQVTPTKDGISINKKNGINNDFDESIIIRPVHTNRIKLT